MNTERSMAVAGRYKGPALLTASPPERSPMTPFVSGTVAISSDPGFAFLYDASQPDAIFLRRVQGVGGNQADSHCTRFQLKYRQRKKQNECHRKESAATHSWPKGHRASASAIISRRKGQGLVCASGERAGFREASE